MLDEGKTRVCLGFNAKDQSHSNTSEKQRNGVAGDLGLVLKGAAKGHGETW